MSINQVVLTGRVGNSETLRFDSGSTKIIISLAVEDFYHGEKVTHWVDIECWNDTAELVQEYVHKGDLIGITGSLKTNVWEMPAWNQEKNEATTMKRKQILVRAHRIEFLKQAYSNESSPQS